MRAIEVNAYIGLHAHMSNYTYVYSMHAHIHTCMHAHKHTQSNNDNLRQVGKYNNKRRRDCVRTEASLPCQGADPSYVCNSGF